MYDISASPNTPNQLTDAPASGKTIFKIGDLAREFGVTLRTLRFYEDKGLINPSRSGTTRLYGLQDRERLRIALFCKRIGMSLGEIREVLELTGQLNAGIHDGQDYNTKLQKIYTVQLGKLKAQHLEIGLAISELENKIGQMSAS